MSEAAQSPASSALAALLQMLGLALLVAATAVAFAFAAVAVAVVGLTLLGLAGVLHLMRPDDSGDGASGWVVEGSSPRHS